MGKSSEYYEIDLMQLLRLLWRKAWAIILAAVIGGAAAFSIAAFLVTPKYEAKAMMYVNNSSFSVGSTSFSISSTELSAAQSLVDTYLIILTSRTTLNEVIRAAELDYSYETLNAMLSAGAVNGTEVFSITVTSEDPYEAKLIANTIVDILPDRISDVVDGSSVRVVDYAVIPSEKASPNITKFTMIGLLLGVVVACAVLFLRMTSDTLIHNEDYLMETYDLPVLAVIPDLSSSNEEGYYGAYQAKPQTKAPPKAQKKPQTGGKQR